MTDNRTDERKHAIVRQAAEKVGASTLAHMTGFRLTNVQSYLSTGAAALGGWRQDELVRAAEWALNPSGTWKRGAEGARK
jgi:hypothetical protein